MARIKLSPIVSSINGKIGNIVFQGSKSGLIIRERVIPRNTNTVKQQFARGILVQCKANWQATSTAYRDKWVSLALFMQKKQKHSSTRNISAYELFMQSNFIKILSGLGEQTNTTLETATIVELTFTGVVLTSSLFTAYMETSTQGAAVYTSLFISKPYKSTACIPKSSVRYIKTMWTTGQTMDLTSEYIDLFGQLPISGQKVLIKRVAFLNGSGWISKNYYEEIIL